MQEDGTVADNVHDITESDEQHCCSPDVAFHFSTGLGSDMGGGKHNDKWK